MPGRRNFRDVELVYLPAIFLAALLVPVASAGLLLPERVVLVMRSLENQVAIQQPSVDVRILFGVLSVLWAACWLAMFLSDREGAPSPWSQTVYGLGAIFLTVEALVVITGAGRSSEAPSLAFGWFAATFVTSFGGMYLATRLEDGRATTESAGDESGLRPRLEMSSTQKAVWIGSQRAWGYRFTVIAFPVMLAAMVIVNATVKGAYPVWGIPQWLVMILLCGYSLLVASVEVVVGHKDVSIRGGPLRVPLKKIPLDAIEGAEPIDVRPWDYGGWGYHPKRGRTAFIMRGGDGLLIHTRRGRDVVVTIEDSEQAAALINDLLQQGSKDGIAISTA